MQRRRHLLGLACLLSCSGALAQSARKPARVAYVSWFAPTESAQVIPLREGLRERGWEEGRNLQLTTHFTAGSEAHTREVLADLVRTGVDVLVVRATNAAHLAKELAPGVPVVMLVSDPLASGLVKSLSRPEGHLTGLSLQGPDLAGKRLEYLRSMFPRLSSVAFLGAADDPNVPSFVQATRDAARQIGVKLHVHLLPGIRALDDKVFAEMAAQGVQAVLVQPIFTGQHARIVAAAMQHRIAVTSNYAVFAQSGALLALGPDDAASTRRSAYFVDRILHGASPSDLPVEQPSRFTLALNRTTARTLGLRIPTQLLLAADKVYE